jgi:hypothetical protein
MYITLDQPMSRPEQRASSPLFGQAIHMHAEAIKKFLSSSSIWWWISSLIVGAWAFAMAHLLL